MVLEVGAGLGRAHRRAGGRRGHVHAFEIDRSLEAGRWQATLAGTPNVTLHFEDVLKASLETLEPAPTLCASNLPYSVAGPFVIEIAAAAAARPPLLPHGAAGGGRADGGPAGQQGLRHPFGLGGALRARSCAARPLSRSIFYPQPHVDSSLIVLERLRRNELPGPESAQLRSVIQAAFGQRRKTLVNALSAGLGLARPETAALVEGLGLPADIRAERLTPQQFAELALHLTTLK